MMHRNPSMHICYIVNRKCFERRHLNSVKIKALSKSAMDVGCSKLGRNCQPLLMIHLCKCPSAGLGSTYLVPGGSWLGNAILGGLRGGVRVPSPLRKEKILYL